MNNDANANNELTAHDFGQAFRIAVDKAREDHGPADPEARDEYVGTYTVRVDGVLTRIDVEADEGHYYVSHYEDDYGDLGRVVTDGSGIPEFVDESGSDFASSVVSYISEEPDLLAVIRHELTQRDDVTLHSPGGSYGRYVLSFPYDSEGSVVKLVEQLAIAHAMAAADFHASVADEVAEAILDDLREGATGDEFLQAAIGRMYPGGGRAEAFLWEVGLATPWADGARSAAEQLGYSIRLGSDGFRVGKG